MHGIYTYEQFREMNKHPNFGYITKIRIHKISGDEVWFNIDDNESINVTSVAYIINLVYEGRAVVTNPSALKNWSGFIK